MKENIKILFYQDSAAESQILKQPQLLLSSE